MALEGHGVFVAKSQQTKFFSTDFDNLVTKVNNGISTVVMQEGR